MAAFVLVFSQNPLTNQRIAFLYHQKPISFPKSPLKPSIPYICLHCSSPNTQIPPSFLIRPTVIAIVPATLLLSRFSKPSLACPPPNSDPSSQALALDEIDAETEQSIEELRSLLDAKIKSNGIPEAISIVDQLVELEPENSGLPLLTAHLLIQSGDIQLAKKIA